MIRGDGEAHWNGRRVVRHRGTTSRRFPAFDLSAPHSICIIRNWRLPVRGHNLKSARASADPVEATHED